MNFQPNITSGSVGVRNKARLAKWLDNETKELPPVAFVVPLDEEDTELLGGVPTGEAGQKWVTEWATTEFKSRYDGAIPRFENEIKVAQNQVDHLEHLLLTGRKEFTKTPATLITSRTHVEFPEGFLRRWLVFVCLILCSQVLLEWWNAASFARFELQDMKAALAFTYSLAVAPIALKLFAGERSRWKRVLLLSLACGALFGFVHVFTDSYISSSPNLTADQLLDQIGQVSTPSLPFWEEPLNPRWRFMWQTFLFALTGFAFSNCLVRHLNVVTTSVEIDNPAFGKLRARLQALIVEREHWGKRYAEAEGNRQEWQASLERHILRCLAYFRNEEQLRRDEAALETFLKQKAERRNHRPNNKRN